MLIFFRDPTIQEQEEGARRLERDLERLNRFRSEHRLQYWILLTGLVAGFYLSLVLLDHFLPIDPNTLPRYPPFYF